MPDYRKLASDMVDMAMGGPIAMLDYGARATTGDLLFPGERLSRYRPGYGPEGRRMTMPEIQAEVDKLPTKELQMQWLRSRGMIPQEVPAQQRLPGTDVVPLPATTGQR